LKFGTQKDSAKVHCNTKFGSNIMKGDKVTKLKKVIPICCHAYMVNCFWQKAEIGKEIQYHSNITSHMHKETTCATDTIIHIIKNTRVKSSALYM